MKKALVLFSFICLHLSGLSAQVNTAAMWSKTPEQKVTVRGERYIIPNVYQTWRLELDDLKAFLANAPLEETPQAGSIMELSLPMPDGSIQRFDIEYSPVMEDPLRSQYPEIRTYRGVGIDDPTAYMRFDVTPRGFHAMILTAQTSTVFIDPYDFGNTEYYLVYYKKDFVAHNKIFECNFDANRFDNTFGLPEPDHNHNLAPVYGDCQKRTYRLALACTGEYATFHGGTVAGALAAMNTSVNRVNTVYEKDVAVRMNIIGTNSSIIYLNATTDPYTNNNGGTMLGQNQTTCTNVIGAANYDIGHVFSTGGGGIASLGSVCNAGSKAQGVTGSGSPIGDPFDIDYVAHEIGHQFGGNHTFSDCNGNENAGTAYEPGGGTTIMAYAGICGNPLDIQNNSDPYFHNASLSEIATEVATHNGCAVITNLANTGPVITNGALTYTIPISTPFFLTAAATDAQNDPLTYCWEQYNASTTATQPPVATATAGPNFRTWNPTTSPTRYFPRLSALIANGPFTWEVLPSVARTMAFRCAVRDNSTSGEGCTTNTTASVTTSAAAGPFVVTAPNTTGITWPVGSVQTVTWNVASTDLSPVSCANVNILLSTDGGLTYPITLLSNTPNDGTQAVTVPNNITTTARVMVVCASNIFFDVNNANFAITAPVNDFQLTVTPATNSSCGNNTATFTANVNFTGTFTNPVAMSATGVPAPATFSFSPNPVTATGSSTLTVGGLSGVTAGTYTITVTGTATGATTKTQTVTLTVGSGTLGAVTLNTPANGATGQASLPTFTWTALSGASSYQFDISTNNTFSPILETASGIATTSYTVTTTLSAATTYYWRVRAVNNCGNGTYSTTFSFTTSNCTTYNSTNVPLTISAGAPPITVNSTVTIPVVGTITDLNLVNLGITHSYIGDVRVSLINPAGTTTRIMVNQVCNTVNVDNMDIDLDDQATNTYANIPCPPTSNLAYQPNQTLAIFNGQVTNGAWTLRVEDLADVDGGTLDTWGLNVCYTPSCSLAATTSSVNATCVGNNGSATVTPTGGTNYTYLWSNGGTTATITGLTASTYGVTVTSGTCVTTTSATVTQSGSISATTTVTATSCSGSTGSATATPTGGSNYTYIWNNGRTTAANTGLAAGTYTVTVTSGTCTATASAVVTQTGGIAATASATAVSCVANSGSATVTPTGGSNYTYIWNNGRTTAANTGLAVGTYTVTVTSGLCTATASANVTQSGSISTTASATSITCAGNNGSVTATPTGGSNYTYLWNNGATTASISNASAGAYTVTVTSGICSATASATVTQTGSISTTLSTTATACSGNTGSATATPSGGSNYTYLWNTGATTATINNLGVGNYRVTVTFGVCTATATADVSSQTPPTPVASNSGGNCSGSTLQLTASGGTSYNWSGPNGFTGNTATPSIPSVTTAASGIYTVTVTNAQGCAAVTTTNVTVNLTPTPSATAGTACQGGSIALSVTGGTTYSWSGPASFISTSATPSVSNATSANAGVYTVTATNTGGCTATTSATATVNSNPTATASNSGGNCAGGTLMLNATGGTSYTWSGPNGFTGNTATPSISNITTAASGSYIVTVTNASGCSATASTSLQVSDSPAAAATSNNVCAGGTIAIAATGGTGYTWTGPNSYTSTSASNTINNATTAASGVYTVTVSNAWGCTATASTTATVTALPVATAAASPTSACIGGTIQLSATGGSTYSWTGPNMFSSSVGNPVLSNLSANGSGVYTVVVTGLGSCTASASVNIGINPTPILGTTVTNVTCFGNANGAINLSASTTGNQYFWNDGTGAEDPSGLAPGTYSVTVTSGAGCTATTSAVINSPTQLNGSATGTPSTGTDGTASVSASGGTAPYIYTWNTGQGGSSISGLAPGTYTVTVTDDNGCETVVSALVDDHTGTEIISGLSQFDVVPNPNDGTFNITLSFSEQTDVTLSVYMDNGQLVRRYIASGKSFTIPADITDLATGVYIVQVRTANGYESKRVTKIR